MGVAFPRSGQSSDIVGVYPRNDSAAGGLEGEGARDGPTNAHMRYFRRAPAMNFSTRTSNACECFLLVESQYLWRRFLLS